MLPVNFAKFLRKPFFTEHIRWLLLHKDVMPDLHTQCLTHMLEYTLKNTFVERTFIFVPLYLSIFNNDYEFMKTDTSSGVC